MIEFDEARPRRPYESVVPLINVVFLLLVFFLLAGTLQPTDDIDVDLPVGQVDDKRASEDVILYVEADGFVYLGETVMSADLAPYMLRKFLDEKGVFDVSIKADEKAPAHELIKLMEGLRNVGVREVNLVTEQSE
ncbi:MAG: biopolymer transporter ExbD [Alphaproteobacteria bacterium]|nr:biopolymer transporter ExbD [Alphaproteobacteria bacterium]MBO6628981.1 biopolymer transporter ExbD [Alphaproteobacteria bacterium]MDF1624812.1 biopolymer transporter ExbD [Parvibaculaceae bacterium]|tara:strand:- start:250 stop:654 length:405 start_codon:yes stop_codon:yes gene_type:complete